jgi:2'-hydroxyisoflavone reductase
MRILVLGGTIFLGRHFVEAALQRGHEVTLFHRGQHEDELFKGTVKRVFGDRATDLRLLEGSTWDAVLDTCGYLPRVVSTSAEFFAGGRAKHYVYVSSVSVYKCPEPGADESWPREDEGEPGAEAVTGDNYGFLKARCEDRVVERFPNSSLIVRPGLIVGPHDPTDRFTYWPVRMARGGDVAAPAAPDQPVQIIDVRDLADWMVRAAEVGLSGAFSATGPEQPLTLKQVLETCKSVANPEARIEWVGEDVLESSCVTPWTELPLYVGPDAVERGMMVLNVAKAVGAGLTFRPLEETVRDVLAWHGPEGTDRPLRAGLTPEREQQLLELWWS